MLLNARPVLSDDGTGRPLIVLGIQDVTGGGRRGR